MRTFADAFDPKRNNFNFLRLLLAVVVIYSHSAPLLYGPPLLDVVGTFLSNQVDQIGDHAMDSGHIAVYGFFAISGFLITMSWRRRRSAVDYFKKRVLRIYPGFIVAMLLGLTVFGFLGAKNHPDYASQLWNSSGYWLLRTLNLAPIWNHPPFTETLASVPYPHVLNGSLWTIRHEFVCYVMVAVGGSLAILARTVLPRRILALLPALTFVGIYGVYAARLNGRLGDLFRPLGGDGLRKAIFGDAAEWPRLFTYFAAGACIYIYRRKLSLSLSACAGCATVLTASMFVDGALPLTLPLFGPYLLLAFAFAQWPRLSAFGRKSDLSYGVYLYAFPVQQLLVMHFGTHLNASTAFLAALPPTFLLAWLSWTFVERPAQSLGHRSKTEVNPDRHLTGHKCPTGGLGGEGQVT